jgi:hypothetical protein
MLFNRGGGGKKSMLAQLSGLIKKTEKHYDREINVDSNSI